MKQALIVFLLSFVVGCNLPKDKVAVVPKTDVVYVSCDSLLSRDSQVISQLSSETNALRNDTSLLRKRNDSLRTQLFLEKYRIEKVKYYAGIVTRNKSQLKFLLGWINRAVK